MPVLIHNRQTPISMTLAWGFHWHEICSCIPGVLWRLFVYLMPQTDFQGLWAPWNFLLGSISIPTPSFCPRRRCYRVTLCFRTSEARYHVEMLKAFSETLQQVGDLEERGTLRGTRASHSSKNHTKRMSTSAVHRMGGNSLRTLCALQEP